MPAVYVRGLWRIRACYFISLGMHFATLIPAWARCRFAVIDSNKSMYEEIANTIKDAFLNIHLMGGFKTTYSQSPNRTKMRQMIFRAEHRRERLRGSDGSECLAVVAPLHGCPTSFASESNRQFDWSPCAFSPHSLRLLSPSQSLSCLSLSLPLPPYSPTSLSLLSLHLAPPRSRIFIWKYPVCCN